jgi:membrane-associated phospholipid phosphatase
LPLKEVMRDTTALGGLAIYVFAAAMLLLLGYFGIFSELVVALALLYAVIAVIRTLFFRKRPDRQKYGGFFTKIDAGSFPSMHAMRAAALAMILAQLFESPVVRALFVIGVLAVAFTRVLLKRHYVADVVVGVIAGIVVARAAVYLAPLVLRALGF